MSDAAITMPHWQWEQLRKGLDAIQADYEDREVAFGSDVAAGLAMIDTMLVASRGDDKHNATSRDDEKSALVDRDLNPAQTEAVSLSGGGLSRDDESYAFYSDPANHVASGPARPLPRRPLTTHVPVRFPPETIERVKAAADAEERTVSSWIRRAVDRALAKDRVIWSPPMPEGAQTR